MTAAALGSLSKGTKSTTKRKRQESSVASKKRPKADSSDEDEEQSRILSLENEIVESRKNYNNIATLIEISKKQDPENESAVVASVALCRVFIRLLAAGNLAKRKDMSEKDKVVMRWLRDRLSDYQQVLILMVGNDESALTALTLLMRLLKAVGQDLEGREDYMFPKTFFADIVAALLQPGVSEDLRKEFLEKFVDEYDDIRFHTFKAVKELITASDADGVPNPPSDAVVSNAFDLIVSIEGVPESNEELEDFYIEPPKKKGHTLFLLSQHKRQAQEAWLALMSRGLSKDRKKRVLEIMSTSIAPWFTKPELLMDFLTDCYNAGGSMSLLSLSGVFYLIQERNLDYPSFYNKLYSLLDSDVLHSKHRSRFFRLLDTFLGSSHLPAVMVASFIKRLARLSLNAPPAAIVAIIPWFYNLFKKHPLCTFMMHRIPRSQEEKDILESEGLEDPFLPDEQDPMVTNAIDSCLWEIVQLQSHYHPNVATIAKIISEQFTKQFYNMEDFLDHSYGSLLDAEMSKEVKKAPVVEFKIPKKIFFPVDTTSEEKDSALVRLWDFGATA